MILEKPVRRLRWEAAPPLWVKELLFQLQRPVRTVITTHVLVTPKEGRQCHGAMLDRIGEANQRHPIVSSLGIVPGHGSPTKQ
jgi:hypothetical protein